MLVGQGPDEPALREQVERLGVQQRVRFEIAVTDERLYQLYEGALAVYYGPFDEDYGYVTLEGFAADRPVVTLSDSGGPLEFVTDGETGLVSRPRAAGDRRGVRPAARRPGAARRGSAPRATRSSASEVPRWPDVVARLLD